MISLASMEAFRGINRRPLPGKAAVIADIIWRRKLTHKRHPPDHMVAGVKTYNSMPLWGLFDHLVSKRERVRRNGKAECLGGLEVQDHLELGRKLNRQFAGLRAAQNAIHIGGSATPEVYPVGSVGEQTAVSDRGRGKLPSPRTWFGVSD
jgi:hypothetical protein